VPLIVFDPKKAAQVIAYFAIKSPTRSLDVIKAVKLVYLADRHSIGRWGAPILMERRVSMPHGPVNSETYAHINGEYDLSRSGWSDYLESRANNVLAVTPETTVAKLEELSDADIESLDATWKRFGHMNKWDLRDWTHSKANVPEWEDPNGSSVTIPLERIMTAVGVQNASEQVELLDDHMAIERMFAELRV
jgi:uncharacterized phage-associated protein